MIIALAFLIFFIVLLAYACIKAGVKPPQVTKLWLVFVAVLPQLLFIYTDIGSMVGNRFVAGILVTSQLMLVVFVWFNRRFPYFWLLGLGLGLNLLVISLNNGLMPISPETVSLLFESKTSEVTIGQRLSKDIVVASNDTWLGILSDRFVLIFPDWVSLKVAYSLGDVFLVIGFIWFLWSSSRLKKAFDFNQNL